MTCDDELLFSLLLLLLATVSSTSSVSPERLASSRKYNRRTATLDGYTFPCLLADESLLLFRVRVLALQVGDEMHRFRDRRDDEDDDGEKVWWWIVTHADASSRTADDEKNVNMAISRPISSSSNAVVVVLEVTVIAIFILDSRSCARATESETVRPPSSMICRLSVHRPPD